MKTSSKKKSTIYAVFIIQSLRDDDFKDGENLKAILKISNIESHLVNVEDKASFISALDTFTKYGFRYLHISCHADQHGIEIGGEVISNSELIPIFEGVLRSKRVFFSACKASNRYMATIVIRKAKGQSVVGSPDSIDSDRAALFWPSFYFAIVQTDRELMNQRNISSTLQKCVDLFNAPINYYFRSNSTRRLRRYKIRPGKDIEKKTIKTVSVV